MVEHLPDRVASIGPALLAPLSVLVGVPGRPLRVEAPDFLDFLPVVLDELAIAQIAIRLHGFEVLHVGFVDLNEGDGALLVAVVRQLRFGDGSSLIGEVLADHHRRFVAERIDEEPSFGLFNPAHFTPSSFWLTGLS